MKIAFLVPDIQSCGPVNVVKSIMEELYQENEIYLLAIRKDGSDEKFITELSKYLASSPIFLSAHRSISFRKLSNKLNEVLLVHNIEVIHAHGLIPTVITGLTPSLKYKKITTLHCIPHKDFLHEYGKIKGMALCLLQYLTLNTLYFDYIVSCSQSVQQGFLGRAFGRNRNRLKIIRNGVSDHDFYSLSKREKEKQKELLNIAEGSQIYIFSGRLCRIKRVPELTKKFRAKLQGTNAQLYILGEGVEKELCLLAADNDPNIKFVGFVKSPSLYYQVADYVISDSSSEGYPLSIIEAMLCGCQAFLSNIPAHKEIISQYPTHAFYLSNLGECENISHSQDLTALKSSSMALKYLDLYR